MIADTFTLALRLTAVVLAVWVLIRLGLARRRKWKTAYTPKEKVSWRAFFFVSIAALEGGLETVFTHSQEGPRDISRLVVLTFVLLVTYTKDDRRIVINQKNQENS